MDLPLNKINDEVFITSDEIVRFSTREVDFIKKCALQNYRGRARICAHKKPTDILHEMLIGIRSDSYIRPHKHKKKVESFHLVEGVADIVILNENGEISDIIELGPDRNFYYRLEMPRYHTLLINSPLLVIHETTNGPFDPTQYDFASFSPPEGDPAVNDYLEQLKLKLKTWKKNR